MRFDTVPCLYLLIIIPVIVMASMAAYKHGKRWLYVFGRQEKKMRPHLVTTVLLCAMAGAVILSLADPGIQYERTVFHRSGIEIALGIDVSKSMLAEDVAFPEDHPGRFNAHNRLNRARLFALSLISGLHGERIGAFIFSQKGVEIIPLTHDYAYCNYILKHINANEITVPGSDLGNAVKTGISMLQTAPQQGTKVLVMLSDGEDLSDDPLPLTAALGVAAEKGIRIYAVGIGTGKPALIPVRNEDGSGIRNYLLDQDGSPLKTRLEPQTLKRMARVTGGAYFQVTEKMAPRKILDGILTHARGLDETKRIETARFDMSPVFLFAAVVFAVMNTLMHRFFSDR